jgi:mRNA interferase RelE/StbE
MAEYAVVLARSARKDLERLPDVVADRAVRRIEALARAPRPPDCKKLQGARDLWRIRVGEHRVI